MRNLKAGQKVRFRAGKSPREIEAIASVDCVTHSGVGIRIDEVVYNGIGPKYDKGSVIMAAPKELERISN